MAIKKSVLYLDGKKIFTRKIKEKDRGKTFNHQIDHDLISDGVTRETVAQFNEIIPPTSPPEPPVNKPPVLDFPASISAVVLTLVTISGTIKDLDGTIQTVTWNQTNGPSVNFTQSEDNQSISFTPTIADNNYRFKVSAIDDKNAPSEKEISVVVLAEPLQCPEGTHEEDGVCVPDVIEPEPCPEGQHRDPVTGECVPDDEPEPEPEPQADLVITAVGDTEDSSAHNSILQKMALEKPDKYCFLGDSSYDDNDATQWTEQVDANGLKEEIIITRGNHEHSESSAAEAGRDIEEWMPNLTVAPVTNPSEPSWENTTWLSGQQVKNAYIISMNSQDLDREFPNRTQFVYVSTQLALAKNLRDSGEIDWIFVIIHKPFYTLKTSHSPETALRQIYQPLFDAFQVDFVLHGHNHNIQNWLPMRFNATQQFTKLTDGTFDFSKPHGQFYIISGAGGHEHNSFSENPADNPNVFFTNATVFGYHLFLINGKKMTVQTKNINSVVINEFKVSREGGIIEPPVCPPGQHLENGVCVPDEPPEEPEEGEMDAFSTKWIVARGATTVIEQTRDEANDDRWSGNVTGLSQGAELTMIAKSIGIASGGHFAAKLAGGNHSGSSVSSQRWYDLGLRQNGDVQLQWEGPHPSNHTFTLPADKQFITNIGKGLEGNWIGLKWIIQKVEDGIRVRMYVDTDPFIVPNIPRNDWRLCFDFVDRKDLIVLQPETYQLPDEWDCEVRRSDTQEHEVFRDGLIVRKLT